jgi:hypothetical protein
MITLQDRNITVASDVISEEIHRLIDRVVDTPTFEKHIITELRMNIIGSIATQRILEEHDLEVGVGYTVTVHLGDEVATFILGSIVEDDSPKYMFTTD